MLRVYVDNSLGLATPLLACLGKHRHVDHHYYNCEYKRAFHPFESCVYQRSENCTVAVVDRPEAADYRFICRADYPVALWWYMADEGLVDNQWKKKYNTYAHMDDVYYMQYQSVLETQAKQLNLWPDRTIVVPFLRWNMEVIRNILQLAPDMEADMAADAWHSWLQKRAPQSIQHKYV